MTVYAEIRAERRRQRHGEGFGDEHDDAHTDGSLAQAAACYAWGPTGVVGRLGEPSWPASWAAAWDKREKHSRRRQLVIAAALCVAEIQRLDRGAVQEARCRRCGHSPCVGETGGCYAATQSDEEWERERERIFALADAFAQREKEDGW